MHPYLSRNLPKIPNNTRIFAWRDWLNRWWAWPPKMLAARLLRLHCVSNSSSDSVYYEPIESNEGLITVTWKMSEIVYKVHGSKYTRLSSSWRSGCYWILASASIGARAWLWCPTQLFFSRCTNSMMPGCQQTWRRMFTQYKNKHAAPKQAVARLPSITEKAYRSCNYVWFRERWLNMQMGFAES